MARRRYYSSVSETFEGLVFLLSIVTVLFSIVDYCRENEDRTLEQRITESGTVVRME